MLLALALAATGGSAACSGGGNIGGARSAASTSGGTTMTLGFTTAAFVPDEKLGGADPASAMIPAQFAMKAVPGGRNLSIPYEWGRAPAGTRSWALTLVDTAPVARQWVHWMVIDIPADATGLPSGASGTSAMPRGAVERRNSFGSIGYGGPQPPAGTGAHPYVATLYALDVAGLELASGDSLAEFRQTIEGHVLTFETCTGRFGR